MKYVANPVEVEAFVVTKVESLISSDSLRLTLDDGQMVVATPDMIARMAPAPGDYWVIQSDGYIYLNPKGVFERKYRKVGPPPTIEELEKILNSEGEQHLTVHPDGSVAAE